MALKSNSQFARSIPTRFPKRERAGRVGSPSDPATNSLHVQQIRRRDGITAFDGRDRYHSATVRVSCESDAIPLGSDLDMFNVSLSNSVARSSRSGDHFFFCHPCLLQQAAGDVSEVSEVVGIHVSNHSTWSPSWSFARPSSICRKQ